MKSRVRAAILGAGAVAIFAALPTNNIAVAYADVETFLTDKQAAGFNNGDGTAQKSRSGAASVRRSLAACRHHGLRMTCGRLARWTRTAPSSSWR